MSFLSHGYLCLKKNNMEIEISNCNKKIRVRQSSKVSQKLDICFARKNPYFVYDNDIYFLDQFARTIR